jgi:hypothetical protein
MASINEAPRAHAGGWDHDQAKELVQRERERGMRVNVREITFLI